MASQPVGLGIPLSSNNRANINTPIGGAGGGIAGVVSLNAEAGNLAIVGDASISVTKIGAGQIQISTAGNPHILGPITCTSLVDSGPATISGTLNVGGATTVSGLAVTNGLTVAQGGPTALLTVSGTAITIANGLPLNVPYISTASLGYREATVNIGAGSFTQYSLNLCGTRFFWGTGVTGSAGSFTAIPLNGEAGNTAVMCQVNALANSVDDAYKWSAYTATFGTGDVTVNVINTVSGAGVTSAGFTYLIATPSSG
jgi:hypothetical protein